MTHRMMKTIFNQIIFMIQRTYLKERLDEYITANNFELSQIEAIYKLVALKRDAEAQYLNSIEMVRGEADRVSSLPGMFISDLINDFKVYLGVIQQNQAIKVKTYDTEILVSLQSAIHKTVDSVLANRVIATEQRIAQSLAVVRQKRGQLKSISQEIQLLRSEVRFKEKMRSLTAPERTALAQKFQDLIKLRENDLQILGQHIANLVNCSELYGQTFREIQEQEKIILEPKASTVYDNFVRCIVIDTTAIRNLNFEIDIVFKQLKSKNQTFNKEKALRLIRSGLVKEVAVQKTGLFEKYKLLSREQPFSLQQKYIPDSIKQNWRIVEGNFRGFLNRA